MELSMTTTTTKSWGGLEKKDNSLNWVKYRLKIEFCLWKLGYFKLLDEWGIEWQPTGEHRLLIHCSRKSVNKLLIFSLCGRVVNWMLKKNVSRSNQDQLQKFISERKKSPSWQLWRSSRSLGIRSEKNKSIKRENALTHEEDDYHY